MTPQESRALEKLAQLMVWAHGRSWFSVSEAAQGSGLNESCARSYLATSGEFDRRDFYSRAKYRLRKLPLPKPGEGSLGC